MYFIYTWQIKFDLSKKEFQFTGTYTHLFENILPTVFQHSLVTPN